MRTPFKLAILFVAIIGAAGYVGLRVVHAHSRDHRLAQILVQHIAADASQLSALEWQALARGGSGPPAEALKSALREDPVGDIDRLVALEPADSTVPYLRRLYASYYDALRDEAEALVDRRNLEEARAIDDNMVDPAYELLTAQIDRANAAYRARAVNAEQTANVETGTLLAFLVATIAVIFVSYEKAVDRSAHIESQRNTLRDSEEHFRGLFENSSIGHYRTTPEGKVLLANASLARMLGYQSVEELATCNVNESNPSRDLFLELIHETGEVRGFECAWLRPDGSPIWIRESARAVHDTDGTLKWYEGTVEDFSARRTAEDALKASENRLSRIVENNADGILLLNVGGIVTFANTAAREIFGDRNDNIIGLSIFCERWDIRQMDGHPFEYETGPLSQVLAGGGPVYGFEVSARHADGRRIILSVNLAPLQEATGQAVGVVASFSDVTERKTLEERLTHQAFHDPLTNLPNRTLLLDRLRKALDRSERSAGVLAVLFIDMDNFKIINDSLGHAMGDRLLQAVAKRLLNFVRVGDTAARFGGDEFVVVTEGVTTAEDALAVARRILDDLRAPFALGTHEVVVTPSIGVALNGLGVDSADVLLRNADAAMYAAKTRGRGRVELFQQAMNAHALDRLEMEADLRCALDRHELLVYYQPSVSLGSGRVSGLEALVRWQHPVRGLIGPTEFIPLAEETGLIVSIGKWVLREACRQAKEWGVDADPASRVVVAVNLSARQFQDPNLIADVASALNDSGLDPACLALEITESVVMDEAETTLVQLHALKSIGLKLSIDDFGTGYSSLSYLKRFPMDEIKIDRIFVDGLGHDCEDSVIVSATISLAHALGLTVVAEGTESVEQVMELQRLGCDIAQGYCFAQPLEGAQVPGFLRTRPLLAIVGELLGAAE